MHQLVPIEHTRQHANPWNKHNSFSLLNPFVPKSFVVRSSGPVHFTVSLPLIVKEVALVLIIVLPNENPVPILFVVFILAFVLIGNFELVFLPKSVAMSQSIFKVALINWIVAPFVLSLSLGLAVYIPANVVVSIWKPLFPEAMLKTVLKLANVLIPIEPHVFPLSVSLAKPKLPLIIISLDALPDSKPMLEPVGPLPLVGLPVGPEVLPSALRLSIDIISHVETIRRESFIPHPMFGIILPCSFVYPTVLPYQNSLALSHPIESFSKVKVILKHLKSRSGTVLQFNDV